MKPSTEYDMGQDKMAARASKAETNSRDRNSTVQAGEWTFGSAHREQTSRTMPGSMEMICERERKLWAHGDCR